MSAAACKYGTSRVAKIERLLRFGFTPRAVAADLGISEAAVWAIVRARRREREAVNALKRRAQRTRQRFLRSRSLRPPRRAR